MTLFLHTQMLNRGSMQSKKCKWIIIGIVLIIVTIGGIAVFDSIAKKSKFSLDTQIINVERVESNVQASIEVRIEHSLSQEILLTKADLALYQKNQKIADIDLPGNIILKPHTVNVIPVTIALPMKELMSLGIILSPSFYIKGKVKTRLFGLPVSKSIEYPIDFNYRLLLENERLIESVDSTLIKVGKKVLERIKTKL